jgi:hypothetical protein
MRHLPVLFLLLTATLPAWPQNETPGRLFFTPQQRAALDRERALGLSQRSPNTLDDDASYIFDGEVRRSSGKNTRWINGVPHTTATRKPEVAAGDTYHPATGERESVIGDGKIVVKRKPVTP